MNYLRINIFLLIIGMTILLVGCDNFKKKDGGSCEYARLIEAYKIDQIDMKNESNYSIRFINKVRSEITRELNQNFIKENIPNFNSDIMQDTSKVYMITVDIITSGSCTPEIITGIKLKN